MYQLILVLHIIIALALIGLVLIQQGKGAEMGASFGSGASNTVFGSQGTGGFIFKLTGGLALAFFVTSLLLSYMISSQYHKATQQVIPQETSAPLSLPIPGDNNKSNKQ